MTESSKGERTVIVSAMSTDDTCRMSSPRHPFLDWDGPLPFAHRGGASDVPENTMQAFEYAVDLGYRYLETDVQVTSDGVLVAFHDNDLLRTRGRPGKISELPWSEVSNAAGRRQGARSRCSRICSARGRRRGSTSTASPTRPSTRWSPRCAAPTRSPGCASRAFSDLRLRRLRAALGAELCTALGPLELALLRFGLAAPIRRGLPPRCR